MLQSYMKTSAFPVAKLGWGVEHSGLKKVIKDLST